MYLKTAALLACATFAAGALALADTGPTASPVPTASAAPIGSPAPAAIQRLITANYDLQCAAILDPTDKNLDAAFASMAPEFVNVDSTGAQQKRADFIASVKENLKAFHGTNCNNTFASVSALDANTVVTVVTETVTGDLQAPDGKHDLDATTTTQDTWKLESGKWALTQSKDLHIVMKVDGVVRDIGQ